MHITQSNKLESVYFLFPAIVRPYCTNLIITYSILLYRFNIRSITKYFRCGNNFTLNLNSKNAKYNMVQTLNASKIIAYINQMTSVIKENNFSRSKFLQIRNEMMNHEFSVTSKELGQSPFHIVQSKIWHVRLIFPRCHVACPQLQPWLPILHIYIRLYYCCEGYRKIIRSYYTAIFWHGMYNYFKQDEFRILNRRGRFFFHVTKNVTNSNKVFTSILIFMN